MTLTPEQCERLWDAFEAVDKAAAPLAYSACSYVTVEQRRDLRRAMQHYRITRDAIDEESRWETPSGGVGKP